MTPETIAAKYDKKLRDALTEVWAQLKQSTNLKQLTDLIASGDLAGALATLQRVEPALYAAMAPVMEDATLESGRYAAELLPSGAVVSPVVISLTDPVAAKYVRQYVGDKIVEISQETVDAVRNRVLFSVNAGRPPAATARDMRDVIGLNTRQELAVRNFRAALEENPADALSRELRDKRFDATLQRGDPLTKEQIARMVTRYEDGQLRYRTQSIARTESMTAVSVGQHAGITQGAQSGAIRTERPDGKQLRKFWIVTNDGRERPDHRAIPAMNPDGVAIDAPFKTPLGDLLFPRDPAGSAKNVIMCRCRVAYRWK